MPTGLSARIVTEYEPEDIGNDEKIKMQQQPGGERERHIESQTWPVNSHCNQLSGQDDDTNDYRADAYEHSHAVDDPGP